MSESTDKKFFCNYNHHLSASVLPQYAHWKIRRTTTENQRVLPLFTWKLEKWSRRYRLRSLKQEIKLSRHRVLLFIGKHASYNLQCCIAVRLVFISYVHRNVGLNISCYLIPPDKSNRSKQVRLSTWLKSSSVKESKVSDFSAPQVVAGSWRCFLRW